MSMDKALIASSKSSEWETPVDLFRELNEFYQFDIDVCATDENALVKEYWTKNDDCLTKDWHGCCYMNPPYGREIGEFVKKAYEESLKGITVVCLLPARTDTRWWHNYVMEGVITFIQGRLKFINRTFPSWNESGDFKISPAPFPSAVVVFNGPSFR